MPHPFRHLALQLSLFSLCLLPPSAVQGQTAQQQGARPRVGLVLSGGGAKGMAHIGVLSVLEEMGIPVDVVCGTSIGSLVGGLYAMGYDAATLDSLVRAQDWDLLLSDRASQREQSLTERQREATYLYSFSLSSLDKRGLDKGGLIRGLNLANLFARLSVGYHDSIDFVSQLPIPFACVATDMVQFREVDFTSGHISQAMRASMSIPAAFAPVRMDSMVLVDGGLVNNYPADLARRLGADLIIGVSLQKDKELTADDIASTADIVNQLINVNTRHKYADNWADTDVPIRVDVSGYGTASFTTRAVDSLILRGRRAALARANELLALRRRVLGSDTARYQRPAGRAVGQGDTRLPIAGVDFQNVSAGDERYLRRHYRIDQADSLSIDQIESIITQLRGPLLYSNASYSLSDTPHGLRLLIEADSKRACTVSVGARFDNEDKAAIQLNALFPLHTRLPLELEATGRLGQSSMGRAQATLSLDRQATLGLSYQFWHRDNDIYHAGDKAFNVTLNHHQVDLSLAGMQVRNLLFDLMARVDRVLYDTDLGGALLAGDDLRDGTLLSYHARLHYDSQNRAYMPTRGSQLRLEYGLYTTNGLRYRRHTPVSTLAASWQTNARLSSRLTLRPLLYGRAASTGHVPIFLANYVGGAWFGHYADQQQPLAGVGHIETVGNYFAAVQLTAQEEFLPKHFAMLSLSGATEADRLRDLPKRGSLIGGGSLAYAYLSPVGPAGLSLGYSSLTHKVYAFLNLGYYF